MSMKKRLLSLTMATILAGPAYAQSNVWLIGEVAPLSGPAPRWNSFKQVNETMG